MNVILSGLTLLLLSHNAHIHVKNVFSKLSSSDLNDLLKATTIFTKGLREEVLSVKDDNATVRADIHQALSLAATASQVKILSNDVRIAQTPNNMRMDTLETKVTNIEESLHLILSLLTDSDVKKGEKVVKTKCTPDLALRNDNKNSGNDGGAQ